MWTGPPPCEEDWREWQGASPAEQVLQHEGTLVAVYRMNEEWKPVIEGPIYEQGYEAIRLDEESGWLSLHAGTVLPAVHAVTGLHFAGTRNEARVLRGTGRRNALVLETASPSAYQGETAREELRAFAEAVRENTRVDPTGLDSDRPGVRYVSLSGDTLAVRIDEYRRINGEALDLSSWPLLQNPWMHQPVGAAPMHRSLPTPLDPWKRHNTGAAQLRLLHGDQALVYDFEQ